MVSDLSDLGLVLACRTSRRHGLVALRDCLAETLAAPDFPARSVAPMARELQELIAEIDRLPDPTAPPFLFEVLRAKREARHTELERRVADPQSDPTTEDNPLEVLPNDS